MILLASVLLGCLLQGCSGGEKSQVLVVTDTSVDGAGSEVSPDPSDPGTDVTAEGTPQPPDADGDGHTLAEGDCDDRRAVVYPGAEELADGRDNDCDGSSDEGTLLTLYPVDPLSNELIVPDTSLDTPGYSLTIRACAGEYEVASVVLRSTAALAGLELEVGDLIGDQGRLPATVVDLRLVKVWYQAGQHFYETGQRHLTPELLLKDDALVEVRGEDNYLRLTTGKQVHISDPEGIPGIPAFPYPTIEQFPVADAVTLQPFDLEPNRNKQVLLTVALPDDPGPAGGYRGTVRLRQGTEVLGSFDLLVELLPFRLAPSPFIPSIYYRSFLDEKGTLSSEGKNLTQLRAEFLNLLSHGVTHPTLYPQLDADSLRTVMALRTEVGVSNDPLLYLGLGITSYEENYELLDTELRAQLNFFAPYGTKELFIYAPDEQSLDSPLRRAQIAAVHKAGVKAFNAQSLDLAWKVEDLLDVAVVAETPSRTLARSYHEHGHRLFSYANPQAGEVAPDTYRRNFGFLVWQQDYDGVMDYAYQHSFGNIWNDWDVPDSRDLCFTYPTADGVIDTLQWEGFREGLDDVRYLATLEELLERKRSCCATEPGTGCCPKGVLSAHNFLANLKTVGSATLDLDAMRSVAIAHLLHLSGKGPAPATETSCGNGLLEDDEECDNGDFGGVTCATYGYGGTLGCVRCRYDRSTCLPKSSSLTFLAPTPADGAEVRDGALGLAVRSESVEPVRVYLEFGQDDTPVAHWTLDEFEGDLVRDVSGHGNDGSLASGDLGSAAEGSTPDLVYVTEAYRLSYYNAYYRDWTLTVESGPASGASTTVTDYLVRSIVDDKELHLAAPLEGFGPGDTFRLTENDETPLRVSGKFGRAVHLDGQDDYLDLGHGCPDLSGLAGQALTVEVWLRPRLLRGMQAVLTKNGPLLLTLVENRLQGAIYTEDRGWVYVTGERPLVEGVWQHVALVYDGSAITLYLDGQADLSIGQSGELASNGCTQVGRGNDGNCHGGPGQYYQGDLDELRIFRRALSASEVRALAGGRVLELERRLVDLAPGSYEYRACASDDAGGSTCTATRTVVVTGE
ncbi:MAG: hypothetical protein A2284_16910 [Deltaproteobacteria bacterium RIFOXYA12_FULL_61_11]|nr:MAG: hypothetical protein A2284_16910 [Deltaproteobacteria bacterium RIFOXYA12_FULL_61_11]